MISCAFTALLLLAPLAAHSATSQEADIKFAEDMERLAEKNKTSPEQARKEAQQYFDETMKAGGEDARSNIQLVQRALGTFGYGTGPFDGIMNAQTHRALVQYQKHNSLQETGELDYGTFDRIESDYARVQNPVIALPMKLFLKDDWENFVQASGTWILENDVIAYPYNAAEISCYRQLGYCFEAFANMIAPTQLATGSNLWGIQSWDDVEIVSSPIDGVCSRTVLRLNRATSTATKITVPKITAGVCKGGKEVHSTLVAGQVVWEPLFDKYHLDRQKIEGGHWEQYEKQWRSKSRD